MLVVLNKCFYRMIIRFSSASNAYSFQNYEDGVVLSWSTSLEFCRSSKLSLVSILVAPLLTINSNKLIHVSTNICQANFTNPNAYIYSCTTRKPGVIFQKGLFLVSDYR